MTSCVSSPRPYDKFFSFFLMGDWIQQMFNILQKSILIFILVRRSKHSNSPCWMASNRAVVWYIYALHNSVWVVPYLWFVHLVSANKTRTTHYTEAKSCKCYAFVWGVFDVKIKIISVSIDFSAYIHMPVASGHSLSVLICLLCLRFFACDRRKIRQFYHKMCSIEFKLVKTHMDLLICGFFRRNEGHERYKNYETKFYNNLTVYWNDNCSELYCWDQKYVQSHLLKKKYWKISQNKNIAVCYLEYDRSKLL